MSQGVRNMRWWNVVGVAVLMSAGVVSAANEWTVAYTSAEKVPLMAIWGSSADDVWAVGQGGTVIHYDGSTWSVVDVGTDKTLCGVWGSGPKDVYVVGDGGTILHYDGKAWTKVESDTTSNLNAIWGSGPKDVYVVGDEVILHYDGSAWDSTTSHLAYSVWGSGADDVRVPMGVAFGHLAGLEINFWLYKGMHYDGQSWGWEHMSAEPVESVIFPPIAIWGSDASNVYAASLSTIFHCDGSVWTSMPMPMSGEFSAIWGSGAEDIFFGGEEGNAGVIFHHDGDSWAKMTSDSTQKTAAIWGSGADDVYAVGESGEVLRCSGFVPREVKEYVLQIVGHNVSPAAYGLYPAGTEVRVHTDHRFEQAIAWRPVAMGFDHWTGDAEGLWNSMTVTVDKNMLLVAKYERRFSFSDLGCGVVYLAVMLSCMLGAWAMAGRER